MKRLTSMIVLVMLIFGINSLAAQTTDTTKTQTRVREKKQEWVHTQNQNQVKDQVKQKNQVQHGYRFVDENGDGYNDNAPDADGDGIPNGMDPDYQGAKMQKGKKNMNFVDEDGDGINDNLQNQNNNRYRKGMKWQNQSTNQNGKIGNSSGKGTMKRSSTNKKQNNRQGQ